MGHNPLRMMPQGRVTVKRCLRITHARRVEKTRIMGEDERQDKRVRRTRRRLAEALVALTLARGYEAITIRDITARAGVGYRTFFRHYTDKDGLLGDVLQTTVVELRQLMGQPAAPGQGAPFRQFLSAEDGRVLFQHIGEQADLYRVLLDSGRVALDPILIYAEREVVSTLGAAAAGPLPPAIMANFLVNTTIDLVRWWLDHDLPYPPAQMGRYLAILTTLPQEEL